MKNLFIAFSLGILIAPATIQAQQPSDVLKISVVHGENDKLKSLVRLLPGKGPSIRAAIEGTSQELFDLLGTAPLVDFIETPIFDSVEFPGGPVEHRLVYGLVTLSPKQSFFGLVGMGGAPNGPGFTEEEFRNKVFANFEAEVDGVLIRGDLLKLGEPFVLDHGAGPEILTYFNYSQRIRQQGTHRVIYRFTNRQTLGDCSGDCFPAGNWVFDFMIQVTGKADDDKDDKDNGDKDDKDASGHASFNESRTNQREVLIRDKAPIIGHILRSRAVN